MLGVSALTQNMAVLGSPESVSTCAEVPRWGPTAIPVFFAGESREEQQEPGPAPGVLTQRQRDGGQRGGFHQVGSRADRGER